MRNALQDGFEIEELASRAEAVELVRDVGSFDVAIVDMRRRNGDIDRPLGGNETHPAASFLPDRDAGTFGR